MWLRTMRKTSKLPVRVLVIEDDPDILNALNIALGSIGFDVDVLLTGTSVLKNQFVVPDLFIVDNQLPDIDGLEICRFLKSRDNYKEVPVIVISAAGGVRKKAVESGASAFVEKPFEMQHLLRAIKKALQPHEPGHVSDGHGRFPGKA